MDFENVYPKLAEIQSKIKKYFKFLTSVEGINNEKIITSLFEEFDKNHKVDMKAISQENKLLEIEIEPKIKKSLFELINKQNKFIYFSQLNVIFYIIYRTLF